MCETFHVKYFKPSNRPFLKRPLRQAVFRGGEQTQISFFWQILFAPQLPPLPPLHHFHLLVTALSRSNLLHCACVPLSARLFCPQRVHHSHLFCTGRRAANTRRPWHISYGVEGGSTYWAAPSFLGEWDCLTALCKRRTPVACGPMEKL